MSKIIFVNLADLNLPSFQAHSNPSSSDITELSESIKSLGVLEPLLVRQVKTGYDIIAGCLRYQAAHLAGLKAVPCIVMQLDSKQAEIVKAHENFKRVHLGHIDQASTFLMMIEEFGMTEQQISDSMGKSVPYISQHISLLKLGSELVEEVKSGSISFSQARELLRVDDLSERKRLLSYCKNDGASVQILHQWVNEFLRKPPPGMVSDPSFDQSFQHDAGSDLFRPCAACDTQVKISEICQVFYCPTCNNSIKNAISDEKAKSPSGSET